MTILDSGDRTEFASGAVRDIQDDKGRCDLIPLDNLDYFFHDNDKYMIGYFNQFKNIGDTIYLFAALEVFINLYFDDIYTAFLELSIHFKEGANKYGEYNWQKGIPVHSYIDSALRHYMKFRRGDKDERHDRAFMWNLVCAIWTCKNKPELNEYLKVETDGNEVH